MTTDEPKPLVTEPVYPDLVKINFQKGSFTSSLQTLQPLAANQRLVTLTKCRLNQPKAYTTVQYSAVDHLELDNEFVYMNHSCSPSVTLNVSNPHAITITTIESGEGVSKGGELTFDYCSTEWDMDQPFTCTCNTPACRGTIRGAKYLDEQELVKVVGVNRHILDQSRRQRQ